MFGRIDIKVVKETSTKVTIKLISANRNMVVPKAEFEQRLKDGTYNLKGPRQPLEVKE